MTSINPVIVGALAEQLTLLDQGSGLISRFSLNDEQRVVLAALADHDRIAVLKARQQGISTICCLYDLVHAIVHPGHTVAIVADVQEKAEGLLAKCASWAKQLGVPLTTENVRTITLANGSSIEAKSAVSRATGGESRVGRSKSYALIHLSELAFMADDFALFSALTSTLLPGGKVIVESTASPADNLYNKIWHESDNGWHRLFFSVEAHVAYRADEASISDAQWEKLREEYRFTRRDSAAWWHRKLHTDMGSDMYRAQREFPVTPEQAFAFAEGRWIHDFTPASGCIITGNTRLTGRFEVEYGLEKLKVKDPTGREHTIDVEPCIYGVDTGSGSGGDYSALVVIGRITGKIHRVIASNTLDVGAFADLVIARAEVDKPYLISTETNGIGSGMHSILMRAGLPSIEHVSDRFEKATRFSALRVAIESGAIPVGPEIQLEIKSSTVDRDGKYAGRDDVLSALSFARSRWIAAPYAPPAPKVDPTVFVDSSQWQKIKEVF